MQLIYGLHDVSSLCVIQLSIKFQQSICNEKDDFFRLELKMMHGGGGGLVEINIYFQANLNLPF